MTGENTRLLFALGRELSSPLNAILGVTDLLAETGLNDRQQSLLDAARQEGERLAASLAIALDLARFESGEVELNRLSFDVAECLEDAVGEAASYALARGVELLVETRDRLAWIVGDRDRMHQALQIFTALAIRSAGAAEVEAHVESHCVTDGRLEVHLSFNLSSLRSGSLASRAAGLAKADGGTFVWSPNDQHALSLAYASRMVEAMGGRVWVEEHPDTSAALCLAFPGEEHVRADPREDGPDLEGRRALVVCPNDTGRGILVRWLESWGVGTLAVPTLADATAVLAGHALIDAAVVDIGSVDANGAAIRANLASWQETCELPTVFLIPEPKSALGLSVPGQIVYKPVRRSHLHRAVAAAIAREQTGFDGLLAGPESSATPLRILVVDDSLLYQMIAVEMARVLGHDATVAANGLEGLAALREHPCDVVLMDVKMPEMDGIEATRRIRTEVAPGDQPVIFGYTVATFDEEREEMIQAGMDRLLAKPVRLEEMKAALDEVAAARGVVRVTKPSRVEVASPEPYEALLSTVQGDFSRSCNVALQSLDVVLEQMAASTASPDLLIQVKTIVHRLANTAPAFGFSSTGEIARRIERQCTRAIDADEIDVADIVALWRLDVDAMRIDLASHPGVHSDQRPMYTDGNRREVDVLILGLGHRLTGPLSAALAMEGLLAEVLPFPLAPAHLGPAPSCAVVLLDEKAGDCTLAVESIRGLPGGTSCALIVAVDSNDAGQHLSALRSGADAIVEPPVDATSILKRVRDLLDRREPGMARVLVVGAAPADQDAILFTLESAGHYARACDGVEEFVSAVRSDLPDAIIATAEFLRDEGRAVIDLWRTTDDNLTRPILALGTQESLVSQISSGAECFDGFVLAPVDPLQLESAFAAVLSRADRLSRLVNRDGLTRLLTRGAFVERALGAFGQKGRPGFESAIAMLDLDEFKQVNDHYGHSAGDQVLRRLATVLRAGVRGVDAIARFGGDEFALLLDGISATGAMTILERLRDDFGAIDHVSAYGARFRITFSAGVAELDDQIASVNDWIRAADETLIRAKQAGRNRVVAFR